MSTITITLTIDIPDGANVRVQQGNGGSRSDRPFVPRPDPIYPSWDPACSEHVADWRLVPSGVSKKTNKPYNAFYACSVQGCNEKPARQDETSQTEGLADLPF